jgi:hypothetical protein
MSPEENFFLYCAHCDFGGFVLTKVDNLKAVMNTTGHTDVKGVVVYQYP